MTATHPIASVHRFGDKVAIFVGDGSTTYLNPEDADRLAKAISKCVISIRTEKFTDSTVGSIAIYPDQEPRS